MSFFETLDPKISIDCPKQVEIVIIPRTNDIGNFEVMRALPFRDKRMVGPFIFWDQIGPGELLKGQGIDVRPHPHIGLSTVTYLLDGTLDHKDSLGNNMRIKEGDVNLMSAGRGITHSERTGQDIRQNPSKLYGIQSWIAQPKKHEDDNPSFYHTSKKDLPTFNDKGIEGRIILGDFHGIKSPVPTQWETLYTDICLQKNSKIKFSKITEERAIYILSGQIEVCGENYEKEHMIVLKSGNDIDVIANKNSRIMFLGGATMDGPRHIFWNFVASSKEKIEQAKIDWTEGKFPKILGDDKEFIPFPLNN